MGKLKEGKWISGEILENLEQVDLSDVAVLENLILSKSLIYCILELIRWQKSFFIKKIRISQKISRNCGEIQGTHVNANKQRLFLLYMSELIIYYNDAVCEIRSKLY